VRPEGLGKFKKITSSGIGPATFRYVAQRLNHYATAFVWRHIRDILRTRLSKVNEYFMKAKERRIYLQLVTRIPLWIKLSLLALSYSREEVTEEQSEQPQPLQTHRPASHLCFYETK
jgi:hypothetical protein